MKNLLARTLGALALISLIAVPAVATTPAQTADVPVDANLPQLDDLMTEAEQVQVPADLPNKGFACTLPPQQRDEDCVCPAIFDPVCGCDGQTYSNSCFASCVVRSWSDGACS